LIDAAAQPLKTMLLLGVNAGFGNSDVGTVPLSTVDLKGGWLSYARPKTGIARRCPLWPETVRAIKEWLPSRPKSQSEADAGLLFVTAKGNSWAKDTSDNPVSKETRKLLDELGINGGRNFYCLRHTFQTMADESRDFPAVRSIMGHTPGQDIADVYRERISDDRLRAVTEHVRGWLFSSARARGEEAGGQGGGTETVHRVE
jgi:integrase